MKNIPNPKRTTPKALKSYSVDSFNLPVKLHVVIEQVAIEKYGGNKSALVTELLAEALEVELEPTIQTMYRRQMAA